MAASAGNGDEAVSAWCSSVLSETGSTRAQCAAWLAC